MPELPEVELLRQGLISYVSGLTVEEVEVLTPKMISGDVAKIRGAKISGVRRFGKMLAIDFSNGVSLAVHVKMTGRLIYRGKKQPKILDVDEDLLNLPNKHTHVIFSFKNGDKLYYNDVRKFGWIKVVPSEDLEDIPFVKKLGPGPFSSLNLKRFSEIIGKYTRPIKTLLMDQERISGVGNIYANEALFCARVSPNRKASTLMRDEIVRLYRCIIKVLEESIKFGGSSTDAFRNVLGQKGEYQRHYFVYDREGEKCKREGCSGIVEKIEMGGRGTYYCQRCQK